MVVKFYDKIINLVGKDGTKLVGSMIKSVIGSTQKPDAFSSKMRKAKLSGLTRLEVSFRFPDSDDYCFGLPFMKHNFHKQAEILLD
jgi:hypothetical protein